MCKQLNATDFYAWHASCLTLLLYSINIAYLQFVDNYVPCGGIINPKQHAVPAFNKHSV